MKNDTSNQSYQACIQCIMDNRVDQNISFDNEGLCNHCRRYSNLLASRVVNNEDRERVLQILLEKIKTAGRNREYDCIVGISGGVDSTYVAYLMKEFSLRPLAIHFDNGWNSELSVKNIENTLNKLGIDLYTYVINWNEFRDLQISFLKASTPDGEIPTDHAINALLWREASRRKIKYIISGMNFSTESIDVSSWSYGHSDWRYIKDVHRRFGTMKLKTYPRFNLPYLFYVNFIRGIRMVSILNYIQYNKDEAMDILKNRLEWKYYGGKHYESIYTRFYQGYFLPRKFGVDKRYGHLSDLIRSCQLTRENALEEIKNPTYSETEQNQDIEYVIKKLKLSHSEFDQIMNAEIHSFRDYKNLYSFIQFIRKTINKMRLMNIYPK